VPSGEARARESRVRDECQTGERRQRKQRGNRTQQTTVWVGCTLCFSRNRFSPEEPVKLHYQSPKLVECDSQIGPIIDHSPTDVSTATGCAQCGIAISIFEGSFAGLDTTMPRQNSGSLMDPAGENAPFEMSTANVTEVFGMVNWVRLEHVGAAVITGGREQTAHRNSRVSEAIDMTPTRFLIRWTIQQRGGTGVCWVDQIRQGLRCVLGSGQPTRGPTRLRRWLPGRNRAEGVRTILDDSPARHSEASCARFWSAIPCSNLCFNSWSSWFLCWLFAVDSLRSAREVTPRVKFYRGS
jgi:hypothetical protein